MPIPKPNANETQDKFVSRCMSALNEDYPDQKQRAAICYDAWRKRNRDDEPETMKSFFVRKGNDYEKMELSLTDLALWFKQNSDEQGNVKEDVVMLADAELKYSQQEGVEWTMSDESIDRDKERIVVAGWNLKEYKKNPVVLWHHDQARPAIGKVINPKIKDGRLVGRVKFSSKEVDPFAAMIEDKVREGILQAGSVGFKPLQVETGDNEDESTAVKLTYLKQELREFSICNVPANPNALVNFEARETQEEIVDAKYERLESEIKENRDDLGKVKEMIMELAKKKEESKPNYIKEFFAKKEAPKTTELNAFFAKKSDKEK